MFKAIKQFVLEAIRELGRVTWPSRNTVLKMTIGVVVISALFGVYAALVDFGITGGLRELLIWKESRGGQNSTQQSNPIQVNPGDVQVDTTPAK